VLRKVEAVVREEMNRAGALELFMPAVQPAELWQESGRWQKYGPELLRIKDRHQRDFCFGPTHEEVITDLFRREIKSYKQLPINFYQIQTKFRDEIRPRFGVMRAREFLMKDAYSFHLDQASLQNLCRHVPPIRAFSPGWDLKFRAVLADTGSIGGAHSHEFHVLADPVRTPSPFPRAATTPPMSSWPKRWLHPGERPRRLRMPDARAYAGVKTIAELCAFLKIPAERTVKAVVVEGEDGQPVLLLVRGDHEVNAIKAESCRRSRRLWLSPVPRRFALRLAPSRFAGRSRFWWYGDCGSHRGQDGDFVTGANEDDWHLTGVNFGRDCPEPLVADIRSVVEGDPSPDGCR
jgi:prolyl-tRNA synthetase